MQHNFCSHSHFSQRTDRLAEILGCNLNDLPGKIGISQRSLYGYRSGKYPVTAKALRKLNAAEVAAKISNNDPGSAEHFTDPKFPGVGETACRACEDPAIYRVRRPETLENLADRVARLERIVETIRTGLDGL